MTDHSAGLQAQVVQAREQGLRLGIAGSGSYASYLPQPAAALLQIAPHRGVVSYEPSELVITVRAGTPLLELDALLAAQGQCLGGECPRLSAAATIGGAIAMGYSGASRPFSGALCDFVLGVRMLNGLGEILSFGGQVMKNVAGYDLSRLMVGSGGKLGVLLDVSLRVLPMAEETMLRKLQVASLPQAVQFTHALLAKAEPLTGASFHHSCLHLRFAGRSTTMERLRAQLGGEAEDSGWWSDLQQWQMPWGAPVWCSYRERASQLARSEGAWLADWNGARIWSAQPEPSADVARLLNAAAQQPTPPSVIERRLRDAFDPHAVFSGAAH